MCIGCGAAAASLVEIGQQIIHRREVGGINLLPSKSPLRDQSRLQQLLEVKGRTRRRDPELIRDRARRHSIRPMLHKQAKSDETGLVCERRKRGRHLLRIHVIIHKSLCGS